MAQLQLRALTGSTIDLNGDDLGVRVDDNEIIPPGNFMLATERYGLGGQIEEIFW